LGNTLRSIKLQHEEFIGKQEAYTYTAKMLICKYNRTSTQQVYNKQYMFTSYNKM